MLLSFIRIIGNVFCLTFFYICNRWLWVAEDGSLPNGSLVMLVYFKALFLILLSSSHLLMTFLMLSVKLLSLLMILGSTWSFFPFRLRFISINQVLLSTTSLNPSAHCWNLASRNIFYRYCFVRYSSEGAELVQGGQWFLNSLNSLNCSWIVKWFLKNPWIMSF